MTRPLSRRRRRFRVSVLTTAFAALVPACAAATPEPTGSTNDTRRAAPVSAAHPSLVLHVESPGGEVVESVSADVAINPASLVKAATTLWALERLGAEHRFTTTFGLRGTIDGERGRLDGDLWVEGGGDPDFHVENAYLVARELNRLGIREVTGVVRVNGTFWLGWEGGSEKREKDPRRRARLMATRLRDALDPERWSAATRRGIAEFEARRGFAPDARPRVTVRGQPAASLDLNVAPSDALLVHRSNPLVAILKRFNAYSNNDIERLRFNLGTASQLATALSERWGAGPGGVDLATLSGLATNRLTPRQIVRLLRDLAAACEASGIALADVLPVAGCDTGTLKHYPRLRNALTGNLTAKTGTLNVTDGGVSVLAGVLESAGGRRIFCVATPRAGGRLSSARKRQEQWVLDLVEASGGATSKDCGPTPPFSDQGATIRRVGPFAAKAND